jgi:hypothetical protein
VACFPEKYGEPVLALDLLHNKAVPQALSIQHALITAQNLNCHDPHDGLLAE